MDDNEIIYKLKLHETAQLKLADEVTQIVQRVPGGWNYIYVRRDALNPVCVTITSNFVPLNGEFRRKEWSSAGNNL